MDLFRKSQTFLLVTLLVAKGVCQSPNGLNAIGAALNDREFARALELLQPAIAASPTNAQLWAMQGTAYAGLGDNKEALASFQRALKIAPEYLPALKGAAQIEYDAGNTAGIPLLERLLHQQPEDVTGHAMLAVLEVQRGNCAAASSHFERAARLFRSQPVALRAYAACLVKLGNFQKAAEIFGQSLAISPGGQRERRVLASIQLMAQEPKDALATLQPLLAENANAPALELASEAYEQSHDTEQAVNMLRRAILLDPGDVNLYVDFAALSAKHQSFQVGINVVDDGINQQPKAAPLYFARGMLYVLLSEYAKAQDDFETAYRLDPMQSLTAAAQGLTAVQQNDPVRALAGVREKLAQRPNDPILLYLQADVLAQQDPKPGTTEYQTALRSAQRAVALNPGLGPAHSILAELYLDAGKYADAERACRKALEIDPKDKTALYRLIQAVKKADQKGELPSLLKRFAQLRQQATNEERQQSRYRLVDAESQVR